MRKKMPTYNRKYFEISIYLLNQINNGKKSNICLMKYKIVNFIES